VTFGKEQVDYYSSGERIAIYDIESRIAALDVGMNFAQFGELRVGVEGGKITPVHNTGSLFLPSGMTFDQGGIRTRLRFDRLDNVRFPREGWTTDLEMYNSRTGLGAADNFDRWYGAATASHTFGEDNTFRVNLAAGGKLGSEPLPSYELFRWGGFLKQSGYATGQLVGPSLQFGQLVYFHRIVRSSLFQGAYGGVSLEAGHVWDSAGAQQPVRLPEIARPLRHHRHADRTGVFRLRPRGRRSRELLLLPRPADVIGGRRRHFALLG